LRFAFRAGLVVSSVLVALFSAEVYVRLLRHDLVDTTVLRERLAANSIAPIVQPSSVAGLFYELKPNLSIRFQASNVVTSAGGVRIDSNPARTAERDEAARIAVLGDSTPFGWGVDYAQSYPELVRSRLEAALGRAIDLRNYSVPGYNSEQEQATFLQRVLLHKPDLVIVHHDPNDSEPVGLGFAMAPDFIAPEYGDNLLSSALVKLILRSVRIRQNQRSFATEESPPTLINGYAVSGALYDRHLAALESLASLASTLHIPVVTILFNARVTADEQYQRSEIYQSLHRRPQEQFERMGMRVIDLFPFYQDRMRDNGWRDLTPVWRSPSDAHPSPAGHRLIADAVTNYVLHQPTLASALSQP
jgi:lysophospholipase L1-like esterase